MRFRVLIFGIALAGMSRVSFAQITIGIDELLRGDADNDTQVSLSDVIHINNYLFQGSSEPACLDAADANDDGMIDLSDSIYLNNFLFLGGPMPPPPFPYCGPDETEDGLDCRESGCS